MFERVFGFFHKSIESRNKDVGVTYQAPVIFDNDSPTVLVEMGKEEYQILYSLFWELARADLKYASDPMIEPKVALGTITCEVSELDRECQRSVTRLEAMRIEAVQVMTMGFKFIRDICDKKEDAKNE